MLPRIIDTMASTMLGLLASVAMVLVTAVVMYFSYWWALSYGLISFNENGKLTLKAINLPPGSMGLPRFGQTLTWKKNPTDFFDSLGKRHGEIYKTHLFGFPTVVLTTPEAAKRLIVTEANSLKGISPGRQLTELLGPSWATYVEGDLHTVIWKKFAKHLQPEALKLIVPAIEKLAMEHISGWSNGSTIVFVDEADKYTLGVGMLAMFGSVPSLSEARLKQLFDEPYIDKRSTPAPPINKPGFPFYERMQARKWFVDEVHEIIRARQMDPNSERQKGILDSLIDDADPLPQDVIDDNVVAGLFASNQTTAATLSFTVKYLHDHPDVLQAVKDEQENILRTKAFGDPLSWEDLKKMVYTYQVIQESTRLSTVVNMIYRAVQKEVKYKGYVIPKNWRLILTPRQWHHDPQTFPDPLKFDPTRFQTPKPAFTPFGFGHHFCPGYELVRVESLLFLHHLTTKFRWEITKDGPTESSLLVPTPYARLPLKLKQL